VIDVTERSQDVQHRCFRPYSEYRESGVDWLRDVPAHWEMKRLKTVAAVRLSNVDKHSAEGQVPVKLCNCVDVYYNDFITADLDFMNATATPDQMRRFRLRVGDVMVTKDSESWTDIAVPAVVAEDLPDVLCGYHLAHIRPAQDLDGRFLARQFSAIGVRDQFRVAANGITRFGLGGDAIRGGLFAVPPIDEQKTIADFLDRETAKIDALVARKERLMELLQEKRTALITRAVTRGLDPNVPMKDSDVEWLGEIPAHWEAKQLRRAIMFQRGHDLPDHEREEGDVPIVSSSGVSSTHSRAVAAAPGIVTGRNGTIGSFYLVDDDYWPLNTTLYSVHLRNNNPRFLWFMLEHLSPLFVVNALKSAVPGVDRNDIHPIQIAIPTPLEQRSIAAFLDRETAKLDVLVSKIQEAISRLQEFRTALISAAVTGKIDVRAATGESNADQGEAP
jgi:type I restriction enzyme S subunit